RTRPPPGATAHAPRSPRPGPPPPPPRPLPPPAIAGPRHALLPREAVRSSVHRLLHQPGRADDEPDRRRPARVPAYRPRREHLPRASCTHRRERVRVVRTVRRLSWPQRPP